MVEYTAKFSKKGLMAYISHLDLMLVIRRAMRRADLPFVLTEGFTPRVKISIPEALKLGVESEEEKISFWLKDRMNESEIEKILNNDLPKGILFNSIEEGRIINNDKKTTKKRKTEQ